MFKPLCTKLLITALLLISSVLSAKPPTLTPRDTRVKIQEILKAHVCHQEFSAEIAKRALQNYIEEIDPTKTYLLEAETHTWLEASPALVEQVLRGYQKEDFSVFEQIHASLERAIQRRTALESRLQTLTLPETVSASEFKTLTFAKDEKELLDKLNRIRALQFKTAQKIHPENKEQFFQRISKRRANREQELLGTTEAERKQIVLSYVLKSVSSALDSQTLYFTPTEANQFMIQVQQKLFGIGAQLRDDLNGFAITRLVEGGPASLSNQLRLGDKIIAVNKEPIVGMDIVEAVSLIRGPQGSIVDLTILRETKEADHTKEETLQVELVRSEVVLKESRFETSYEPYGDGIIATLQLFSFYQDQNSSSASDLREALLRLQNEQSIKGIILDLRANAGGVLPQAVAVAGLFLSKGVVVSIKDNTGQIQHLRNIENRKVWDGPLIVLTSRASASAAEIVAQTLQEYGRALVVGDPETFGKGTFQTFTLESSHFGKVNPKGEYKVTRGRYYTVSGKSPQLVGVTADLVVPGPYASMEIGEKYAKYPVGTDQIPPNFTDNLSDIPAMHRASLERIYKLGAQPLLTTYKPYLDILKKNSQNRISSSKNYQNFIKESSKEEPSAEAADFFGQNDPQLTETLHIMKDLVYLMEKNAEEKKAA